jgi:hypothetical protein
MKKIMITAVFAAAAAISSTLWAAESAAPPKSKDAQEQVAPDKPRPEIRIDSKEMELHKKIRERGMSGGAVRDPNAVRQTPEDMLSRRKREHQATIKELEDIKKIAESENATKTAEAIQKMIDTMDAEFKNQLAEDEKKRAAIKERAEQRKNAAAEAKDKTPAAESKGEKK